MLRDQVVDIQIIMNITICIQITISNQVSQSPMTYINLHHPSQYHNKPYHKQTPSSITSAKPAAGKLVTHHNHNFYNPLLLMSQCISSIFSRRNEEGMGCWYVWYDVCPSHILLQRKERFS